jgi:hypothetical protein
VVDGVVLYIEQALLEAIDPAEGTLKVHMADYGTWVLHFGDV